MMMNRSSSTFPGFYNWATTEHPGKPIMLGEWGVFYDATNPTVRPRSTGRSRSELHNYPDLHALIDFDMPKPPKPEGNTSFDNPVSALSAFQSLRVNPQVLAPEVVYGPTGSLVN